ncbi:jg19029 [Pararge aegeria aegeria]|uniref:Jg19029 protein n=1 Tax=Pararge aegeria aegeria TaxID=348720 RepID=A0A8S4R5S1_9NEOP|nr:jg19029 [Pararge aegeria aegeria]
MSDHWQTAEDMMSDHWQTAEYIMSDHWQTAEDMISENCLPTGVWVYKLHHFEKIRSDATLNLPYDYTSATHPAWQFWRRVGRIGISTVATYKDQDPDGSIMRSLGQNEQLLSNVDIVKINSIYGVQCFRKQRSFIQTR